MDYTTKLHTCSYLVPALTELVTDPTKAGATHELYN